MLNYINSKAKINVPDTVLYTVMILIYFIVIIMPASITAITTYHINKLSNSITMYIVDNDPRKIDKAIKKLNSLHEIQSIVESPIIDKQSAAMQANKKFIIELDGNLLFNTSAIEEFINVSVGQVIIDDNDDKKQKLNIIRTMCIALFAAISILYIWSFILVVKVKWKNDSRTIKERTATLQCHGISKKVIARTMVQHHIKLPLLISILVSASLISIMTLVLSIFMNKTLTQIFGMPDMFYVVYGLGSVFIVFIAIFAFILYEYYAKKIYNSLKY